MTMGRQLGYRKHQTFFNSTVSFDNHLLKKYVESVVKVSHGTSTQNASCAVQTKVRHGHTLNASIGITLRRAAPNCLSLIRIGRGFFAQELTRRSLFPPHFRGVSRLRVIYL